MIPATLEISSSPSTAARTRPTKNTRYAPEHVPTSWLSNLLDTDWRRFNGLVGWFAGTWHKTASCMLLCSTLAASPAVMADDLRVFWEVASGASTPAVAIKTARTPIAQREVGGGCSTQISLGSKRQRFGTASFFRRVLRFPRTPVLAGKARHSDRHTYRTTRCECGRDDSAKGKRSEPTNGADQDEGGGTSLQQVAERMLNFTVVTIPIRRKHSTNFAASSNQISAHPYARSPSSD